MKLTLTIECSSVEELSDIAGKLGGATVEAGEGKPTPSRSRGAKKDKGAEGADATPSANAGGTGSVGATSQPANNQPQSSVQQSAPTTSAPVIDRKAYNDACIAILNNQLKTKGLADAQMSQFMIDTLAAAGVPADKKITTMSDDQMVAFYPVFKSRVEGLAPAAPAQSASFV